MINVQENVDSEKVRQGVATTLFVEGKDENSFDPTVITEIFKETIRVQTLGPASSVKTAAQALYPSHPDYYFLIDRDFHHGDDFVNKCWKLFPSDETSNLLIWRRKEIENYFLNPEYLCSSKFCRPEVLVSDVENKILQLANERLYLDVANYVLISIREDIKSYKIKKFKNIIGFSNDTIALEKLSKELNAATKQYKESINGKLSSDKIREKFYEILKKMTGDRSKLQFGSGKWESMIEGKKILNEIIISPNFFKVEGKKNIVQGRDKANEIIKGLLKKSPILQPEDFNELKNLIDNKVRIAKT